MRKKRTSETTLKKSKPMIMSDEDFKYYNAILTARKKKFKNSRQACSTIIEGAYMSDVYIDFLQPKHLILGTVHSHTKFMEFPVYNARSKDLYDVYLTMTEYSDGTVSVELARPLDTQLLPCATNVIRRMKIK